MSDVVFQLLKLLCFSGCNPGAVVAALSFHPPKPAYYELEPHREGADGNKELRINLGEDVHPVLSFVTGRVRVERLIDRELNCDVPVICFMVPAAKFTLLFSHGNATDMGGMYNRWCHMATSLGVNVVGYDYTGYGVSEGTPTEGQVYKDITVVARFLLTSGIVKDPARELVLYGQSVGSGPSCYLASKGKSTTYVGAVREACGASCNPGLPPVAGLVIHSGLLSGLRVFTDSRVLGCCDPFQNIIRIRHVQCPTLIIHGKEDVEVPYAHGRGLYDELPKASRVDPWWVADRGHNDVLIDNEGEFYVRLFEFFSALEEVEGEVDLPGMRRKTSGSWTPVTVASPSTSPMPVEGMVRLHTGVISAASSASRSPAPNDRGELASSDAASPEGVSAVRSLAGAFSPTNYRPSEYLDRVQNGAVKGHVLGVVRVTGAEDEAVAATMPTQGRNRGTEWLTPDKDKDKDKDKVEDEEEGESGDTSPEGTAVKNLSIEAERSEREASRVAVTCGAGGCPGAAESEDEHIEEIASF